MSAPRLVIIGGGVTGLSLGVTLQHELQMRAIPASLTVLDAGSVAGGHARTTSVRGFVIESGPNGFLSREPEAMALVEQLGLTSRLVDANPAARRRFILRNGRLYKVPDSPASVLTSPVLSWRGKLRLLAEPFAPGPPPHEETVYDFARRRIGEEAADTLVDTAVSGISAGDSRCLSVAAQFPMMVAMEREHGGLVRAMVARRKSGQPPSRLLSFDAGMGTLTGALAARLGGQLRLDHAVRAVAHENGSWRVRLWNGNAIEADHVILAVAARVAAPLLDRLDSRLSATLREIPYSGLGVVALGYRVGDVPLPLDGYGYLVARAEGLATLGVLWESSIFPARAPEGMVLLRVFIGGARRPDIAGWREAEIAALARRELRQVLGIAEEPAHVSVFRWPDALAQYTLGHRDRCARIAHALEQHVGLHVCGTSYDGVSFGQAITSGRALAKSLADRLSGSKPASAPAMVGAS